MFDRLIVYHIPVCPFSQRLEILLSLRGQTSAVDFRVVDITVPRPADLLRKTRGSTTLPALETPDGRIIKESLVILRYLDETLAGTPLRREDPVEHAIESMLIAKEGGLTSAGYLFLMNQDEEKRATKLETLLAQFRALDDFLVEHCPDSRFLFDRFGLAEAVFAPIFQRFWFLDYYEGFSLPDEAGYRRVKAWLEACRDHPASQQVSEEAIVKLYYDYALGAGNGGLVAGRATSSFAFEPRWQDRPWPPRSKYGKAATDAELGLVGY